LKGVFGRPGTSGIDDRCGYFPFLFSGELARKGHRYRNFFSLKDAINFFTTPPVVTLPYNRLKFLLLPSHIKNCAKKVR